MTQGAGYAAVVLAGGAARRIGGVSKPVLEVGGRPMLHHVLDAVGDAAVRVVVGPADLPLPDRVWRTREQPPGSGPVAAAAAGTALVPRDTNLLALLAADLPFLTRDAVALLRSAATGDEVEGALYVDGDDRPQWLCGVWRAAALRPRLEAAMPRAPLRDLLGPLPAARLRDGGTPSGRPPPWYDCDTGADLRHGRRRW